MPKACGMVRRGDELSMSSNVNEEMAKFWEEIGLVIIHVSDGGVIIGKIIDISSTTLTVRDINGLRQWISNEAVSRIQELGENKPNKKYVPDINEGMPKPFSS
jgi:hypothetical protein